jgi:hypothetical protein
MLLEHHCVMQAEATVTDLRTAEVATKRHHESVLSHAHEAVAKELTLYKNQVAMMVNRV